MANPGEQPLPAVLRRSVGLGRKVVLQVAGRSSVSVYRGRDSCPAGAVGCCLADRKGWVWQSRGFQTRVGQAGGREVRSGVRLLSGVRRKRHVLFAVGG